MLRYDAPTLQKLAERMRRQVKFALLGGFVTGVITGGLLGHASSLMFPLPEPLMIPGAVAGAALGVIIARQRALALRLQSETALCLIEIEKNTRLKSDA